jgi:hypothetical protein
MYGLRGLGLNCPGDPGCPGYVDPNAAAIQAALASAASGACTCVGGICQETGNSCAMPGALAPIVTSQTFGQWLSANGLYVGLGVAGFFMLMAVSKR